MFGLSRLGRRLAEGVVSLFAILGFVYVPLGRHTGLEHAKAVFSTPAAASAIGDLTSAALDLRQRAFAFLTARLRPGPVSDESPIPPPSPKARPADREPRPVPPKLK